MDGGAWWAAVCGVAQSRTRLKRLRSSTFTGPGAAGSRTLLAALLILTCFLAPLWFWQHPLLPVWGWPAPEVRKLKAQGARPGGEAPGHPAPLPPPSPFSPRVLRLLRGVLALVALPRVSRFQPWRVASGLRLRRHFTSIPDCVYM